MPYYLVLHVIMSSFFGIPCYFGVGLICSCFVLFLFVRNGVFFLLLNLCIIFFSFILFDFNRPNEKTDISAMQ